MLPEFSSGCPGYTIHQPIVVITCCTEENVSLILVMARKKIFVLDDSKEILEGMKMFLELKDYEVKTQNHVNNIFEEINHFSPDLIFLDIFLDDLDGREICRKIKQSTDGNSPKIILFSAAGQALEDFRHFGADDCLEKPFGLLDVYSKIEMVLD